LNVEFKLPRSALPVDAGARCPPVMCVLVRGAVASWFVQNSRRRRRRIRKFSSAH